jgi:hypothetical protein
MARPPKQKEPEKEIHRGQPGSKLGRNKLPIDPEQVRKLAMINCTAAEIAAVVGCSVDTINGRFSKIVKEGLEQGKMSLKRQMWTMAMNGNTAICIWLSKQMLGYSEKVMNVGTPKPISIRFLDGRRVVAGQVDTETGEIAEPREIEAKIEPIGHGIDDGN